MQKGAIFLSKVIIPEGKELLDHINRGVAICNECGAVMDLDDSNEKIYEYVCPGCGWRVDYMDYEYDDGQEKEYTDQMLAMFGGDIPPAGCMGCGGPYPQCITSCKMFDD